MSLLEVNEDFTEKTEEEHVEDAATFAGVGQRVRLSLAFYWGYLWYQQKSYFISDS